MAESTAQSSQGAPSEPLEREYGARLAVEDCVCPICLDYFIDVVETRCHHRFCKFCLENWLRVSFRRQCPTCRTIVGAIQVLPQLQDSINSTISPVLNSDALSERQRVRNERLVQLERISSERQQIQSLIARISLPAPQYLATLRHRRFGESEIDLQPTPPTVNLLSNHILNWWDDNHGTSRLNPEPVPPFYFNEEVGNDNVPLANPRSPTRLPDNMNIAQTDRPVPTAASSIASNSRAAPSMDTSRSSVPIHIDGLSEASQFDQFYEETLLEEYAFHLRRSQSAYTRVREGYRDFNYHNGRMQQILEEHRTFFGRNILTPRNESAVNSLDNEHVDYEDFEGLLHAEMRELSSSRPTNPLIANGSLQEDSIIMSRLQLLHSGVQSLLAGVNNFRTRRQSMAPNNRRGDSNNIQSREPTVVPDMNLIHDTNALDMEQEIRSRLDQLQGIFVGGQRWINSQESTGLIGNFSNPVNRGMFHSTASQNTTPIQYQGAGINDGIDRLRASSGQHRLMVERMTGNRPTNYGHNGSFGNRSSSIISRRMRRRLLRGEMARHPMNNINNIPAPDLVTANQPITTLGTPERGRGSTHVGNPSSVYPNDSIQNNNQRTSYSVIRSGQSSESRQREETVTVPGESHTDRLDRRRRTAAERVAHRHRSIFGTANSSSDSDEDRNATDLYRLRSFSRTPTVTSRPISVPARRSIRKAPTSNVVQQSELPSSTQAGGNADTVINPIQTQSSEGAAVGEEEFNRIRQPSGTTENCNGPNSPQFGENSNQIPINEYGHDQDLNGNDRNDTSPFDMHASMANLFVRAIGAQLSMRNRRPTPER